MQGKAKTKGWRSRETRWLLGALAATAFGGLAVGYFLSDGGQAATGDPTIPRGASLASWSDNGQGGRHLLQIADGIAPPSGVTVSGIVVSDTQCEPDARGFSHCHNAIELADGSRITVIDTHQMSRYPCLDPGERLSLSRIAPGWLIAEKS